VSWDAYDKVKTMLELKLIVRRPSGTRSSAPERRQRFRPRRLWRVCGQVTTGFDTNKAHMLRSGQQFGHRCIPMLLEWIDAGEISTGRLATHVMPIKDAPKGCRILKAKAAGCVRAVFHP
jgi:threonine dehydrogenase-like Zn-dependent dehydrogenase